MSLILDTVTSKSKFTYSVYWLAGQSNSNGEGDTLESVGGLPSELDGQLTNIYMLNDNTSNTFEILEFGVNQKDDFGSGDNTGIGQELKLGILLRDYKNEKIYQVKEATGGQSIEVDWNPNTIPNTTRWAETVQKISDVDTYFKGIRQRYVNKCLIWVQGERDALNLTWANNYETNFTNLIARFRTELSTPNLPIICILLREDIPRVYDSIVRQAQINVAENDNNVHLINVDDLTMIDNGVHYSMESQITISERIFNKLKEIGVE